MKTTSPRKDMYEQITDAIIAMLESGQKSNLTWARTGNGLPCNHKTGAAYQGVNVLLLLIHSGAIIREQGEKAFYRRSTDEIYLPQRTRFASEIEFYSVALHELTHWSGAKHRLARDFAARFGTQSYAFEELIAELGSAFLNAELGFSATTIPNHAGYIDSWLKVLKHDKRAIFTAASQASKAHRYIMDLVECNQSKQHAA